jgi:hypothetical protein
LEILARRTFLKIMISISPGALKRGKNDRHSGLDPESSVSEHFVTAGFVSVR